MAGFEQKKTAALRIYATVLLALFVASCGSSDYSDPPKSQGDICAIFAQRPEWKDAIKASSVKWSAPVEVQMAIIWRESSFRAEARPPKTYAAGIIPTGRASSAYGYAQALDGTWDWYIESTGNSGADRDDFEDAADFVGWYMTRTVRSNGVSMFDAYHHYLNYHEGHTGYRRGNWKNKAWLKRAASQVAKQAKTYQQQLRRCG
ncbi:lytic transglycosylase [Rhodobacteraceae bacterium NNCM2]|nr:lytic transglycosylase [Coraliihabitans acroporae]